MVSRQVNTLIGTHIPFHGKGKHALTVIVQQTNGRRSRIPRVRRGRRR